MNGYKIGFWVIFLASLVLFFAPISVQGDGAISMTKAVHIGVFALLTFFGLAAYPRWKILILLMVVGYAASSEYIQSFLPLRHFDWWDMAFDFIGMVVGSIVYFARSGKT